MGTTTNRFFITDTHRGSVYYTSNKQVAESLAACEEYFVVDANSGKWITSDGEYTDIALFDPALETEEVFID